MPARRQAISASPGGGVASRTRGKGKVPAARAKLPTARGHPARFAGCLLDKRAICPRSVRQLVHPGWRRSSVGRAARTRSPRQAGSRGNPRKVESAHGQERPQHARNCRRRTGILPALRLTHPISGQNARAPAGRSQRAKRMQNSFDKSGPPPTLVSSPGGVVAQLAERLNGIQEVRGSNPLGSTIPLSAPAAAAFSGATL